MNATISWSPIRRTSVYHELLELGAVMVESEGWHLPLHFGDAEQESETVRSSVGLTDFSANRKWEIKGADLGSSTDPSAVDVPVPGQVVATDSGWLCRISYKHALLVSSEDNPIILSHIKNQCSGENCSHLLDRTDGLTNLRLSGPRSASVLCKLGAFDLRESTFPDLRCKCGPMAGIQAFLVRRDQYGLPGYEVLFSSEYGSYLWDAIKEAGREFQMRPYGRGAIGLLEG